MVFNKGNGVAAVGIVVDERHIALRIVLSEVAPVAGIGGVVHHILELKIKGSTALSGGVDPVGNRTRVVPTFAYREADACSIVVIAHMRAVETLDHIVAEADIAEVVNQKALVSLDNTLHVGALMVEVAHAREVLSLVVVAAQRDAVALCLRRRGVACIVCVVVGNDVGSLQLVRFCAVRLAWKTPPAIGLVVVNHHVGNGSYAVRPERIDERTQLISCTET